jgi:hypothetical protein
MLPLISGENRKFWEAFAISRLVAVPHPDEPPMLADSLLGFEAAASRETCAFSVCRNGDAMAISLKQPSVKWTS